MLRYLSQLRDDLHLIRIDRSTSRNKMFKNIFAELKFVVLYAAVTPTRIFS